MNKFYLILILLFGYVPAHTQILTIKDKKTGEPVEYVTLMNKATKAYASTNHNGQAEISAFRGAESIEIRNLGYKTEFKSYNELASLSFQMLLTPVSINIEGVVVSATRWKQTSGEVPSKIISISIKDASLQNPQTAADLLNISGKVFVQKSQQGGGSPMIRGFATNRLLYAVDGVRMNTAIFRGGNIQNVISLDPFAIENAEVLFGPGSVIYGSDAIGGVMSFQTLTPQMSLEKKHQFSGTANVRYSSANHEKTGHFNISSGWGKWALVTSASANSYGDLRMGSHGPDEYLRPFYVKHIDNKDVVVLNDDPKVQNPSGYSQFNLMQKIRFKPSQNWDFQYGFHFSATSEYSRYDRHIRYKNGLPRYGEWNYGPQKWMMNNLNVFNTSAKKLYDQISLRLAQQYFEESRISRDINMPLREVRTEKVDAYSVNLDLVKALGTESKLFYGIETVLNDVNSTGTDVDINTGIKQPGTNRYPLSIWSSYGAYISGQLRVSDKFVIQSGLRYNLFKLNAVFDTNFYPFPFTSAKLADDALTGSIGFVYRPSGKWVVSSNAATAFRSPNVDDIGKVFDSVQGTVTVPNPELKAEYAVNFDVSIARIFADIVKFDITGFYTNLQNAMVRRNFTLNGKDSIMYGNTLSQVQAIQNAAVAKIYGVQAGLEIKLAKWFGMYSDFSYQAGDEELDNGTSSPSRHAPPWFGVSRLAYNHKKLDMQFYATYSGKRSYKDMPEEEKGKTEIYAIDKNGNPYSPGWYTMNFKAMIQFASGFTITAGLENITDQRYRPYSSGIVAPGRNFILSVRYIF